MTGPVAPITAALKPSGSYSFQTSAVDPTRVIRTSYVCKVGGCDFTCSSASREHCRRQAREHRDAHRRSLAGGEQSTIFDALAGGV
jgi:hypothetical protein